MPVRWEMAGGVVVVTCVGHYETQEIVSAWEAATAHPAFRTPAHLLLDVRAADSLLRRSVPELRALASWVVRVGRPALARCAIVAAGAARYGLMRMAATWLELEGLDVRVFLDLDDARRWLGSPASGDGP